MARGWFFFFNAKCRLFGQVDNAMPKNHRDKKDFNFENHSCYIFILEVTRPLRKPVKSKKKLNIIHFLSVSNFLYSTWNCACVIWPLLLSSNQYFRSDILSWKFLTFLFLFIPFSLCILLSSFVSSSRLLSNTLHFSLTFYSLPLSFSFCLSLSYFFLFFKFFPFLTLLKCLFNNF